MEQRKEEIIDKIMKLLNLGDEGRNSNPHEREAAAKKAAQLMAEYSIDFIDLKEMKAKSYEFLQEELQGFGMKYQRWEGSLAATVAKVMECKVITRDWRSEEGWFLTFVGTKSDLELAIFLFKYLRRTINRLAEGLIPKKSERADYCYGVILTVAKRLDEIFRKKEEFIPSDCKDLVVIKSGDLAKAFKEMFPNSSRVSGYSTMKSHAAYQKGLEDGRDIPLHRPLSNDRAVSQIE